MSLIINLLRGVAIGLANIIPGVSGGTMALILGIYERLIAAVHRIGPQTLRALFGGRRQLTAELQRIDAGFLATIAVGALLAIGSVAKLMVYLLKEQHDPTYGFFFGLVLASVVFPYRMIRKRSVAVALSALVAIVAVVLLANAMSGERLLESAERRAAIKEGAAAGEMVEVGPGADAGKVALFFTAGAVAISAMILPGISGSFILLLMGVYFDVLTAINGLRQFGDGWQGYALLLGVFAIGCLLGLLLFTRLLNHLLERHHDVTLGFLLGLVIGSLWAIWPFTRYAMVGERRVDLGNVLPAAWGGNELLTLGTMVLGVAVVAVFYVLDLRFQRGRDGAAVTPAGGAAAELNPRP